MSLPSSPSLRKCSYLSLHEHSQIYQYLTVRSFLLEFWEFILTTHNILQLDPKADTFEVNPVVLKTVCAMLQARNLLQ